MCLKIKSGPHIAKKSFYTLKIGEYPTKSGYNSFIRGKKQKYGKLLRSILEVDDYTLIGRRVETGLHSIFSNDFDWDNEFDGFPERVVILCKIPKGSEYYLGKRGDIASNFLLPLMPICIAAEHTAFIKKGQKKKLETIEDAVRASFKVVKKLGYNIKPL